MIMTKTTRSIITSIATLALAVGICDTTTAQQRRFPRDQLRDGVELRKAFRDVIRNARLHTVAIRDGGRVRARGTIVAADGWILTKASEVPSEVSCELPDGRELNAVTVLENEEHDLKLLKVNATGLSPVRWASSGSLEIGGWVATPGVERDPLSVGVISSPAREIPREIGFLGVQIADSEEGARIVQVIPRTAASRAGLEVGDVVTSIDDRKVGDRDELIRAIRRHSPGTPVRIEYLRGGRSRKASAKLGNLGGGAPAGNRNTRRLSRRRSGFPSVFQHDSVLQPSECGGPLVNIAGDVIGVNIAREGRTGSFAIPARVVEKLLAKELPGARARVSGPVFSRD